MSRRFHHSPMPAAEIRDRMAALGMTPINAEVLTGAQARTVERWMADDLDAPHWFGAMLLMMAASQVAEDACRAYAASNVTDSRPFIPSRAA